MLEVKNIPITEPVEVNVPAGTTDIISFPNRFMGNAVAIRITNLDAVNNATYRIGGASRTALVLSAGGNRTINSTNISLLEIVAGGAGATQVEAQVLPPSDMVMRNFV